MATVLEVWGFKKILIGGPEGAGKTVDEIAAAMSFEAKDRGIDPEQESDALDLSRDVILMDAIGPKGDWRIVDETLYVVYGGMELEQLIAYNNS